MARASPDSWGYMDGVGAAEVQHQKQREGGKGGVGSLVGNLGEHGPA